MNVKKQRKVFCITEERYELMRVIIELPALDDGVGTSDGVDNSEQKKSNKSEKKLKAAQSLFDRYYGTAAIAAEEWARNFAEKKIKPEFQSLSDREKKFGFKRYTYNICYNIRNVDDDTAEVTVTYNLRQSGHTIFSTAHTQLWDTKSLLMKIRSKKKPNTRLRKIRKARQDESGI